MIENNKTYGFTIAVKELKETVPNLFRYASAYMRLSNLTSKGLWEMFVNPLGPDNANQGWQSPISISAVTNWLTGSPGNDPDAMEGESYNMCHFWSNFEIARLSFFRSQEYREFFQMMDRSGGFWMERVSKISTFPIASSTAPFLTSKLIWYNA